jgi:two-component system, NarL family, response regulator NreC
MIDVIVADDHTFIREAWRLLLQKVDDIQIVAMVSNGQEAITQAILYCPHVAVMDISMPLMDGIEATKQICVNCPKTRVLMVSMHNTPGYIKRSLEAGALGYVLKDTTGDDLVAAVHSLHEGNHYFSKQIAEIARYYI